MRKTTLVLLFLSILCLLALPVFAEDELFDTKAAAQHVEKGIENLRAKKYDAAIAEFEESVSINPDAEAYYLMGYSYYMKGKAGDGESRTKAKENFEKAYELNPNFSPNKAIAPLAPPAPAPAPAPVPTSKQQAPEPAEKTEPEERPGSVTQGGVPAPAEQPATQTTPPAAPTTTPEPPKEPQPPTEPQPPEPPK